MQWFTLACIAGCAMVVICTLFLPDKGVFAAAIYIAVTWFVGLPIVSYNAECLQRHLENAHPEDWARLLGERGGLFGVTWHLAVDRFARAGDDLDDPRLAVLIRNVVVTRRLPYILLIHYPLVLAWAFYRQSMR
jgi:hypothetical protein